MKVTRPRASIAVFSFLVAFVAPATALDQASIPPKFQIPWGNSAGSSYIRAIPQNSQIGVQRCAASLTDGFPPLTMTPISAGGCPPFGQDTNGILKQISQWSRWQGAGASVTFDAAFSAAIGGYPKNAILAQTAVAGCYWSSKVDNNTSNPDTGGTNWNSSCSARSVFVFVSDFAVCDGVTDDTTNINSALGASAGMVLVFPSGNKTCISGAVNICPNATCANGATRNGAFPAMIYGNGATLKSKAGTVTPSLYLENPPSGFLLDGLNINANGIAPTGLQVFGSQFATLRNINVTGATGTGCLYTGVAGYGFYYNVIQRVACGYNINNVLNSNGGHGVGEYTLSTISPTGPVGCYMSTAYNSSNTFIDTSSSWNGGRGVDINCAHNSHIGDSEEQNLGAGVAIANVIRSDFFGSHTESNDCARCGSGAVGDVSFFGVGSNPGVGVYGGRHAGTFSGINAANNDIVQVWGVTGVGFAVVSGKNVVTVP